MTGTIIDTATGQPVPFAYIWRVGAGPGNGAQADERGSWSFPFDLSDTLMVTSIGYEPRQIVARDAAGVVMLNEVVDELGPVTIEAERRGGNWLMLVLFGVAVAVIREHRNSRRN